MLINSVVDFFLQSILGWVIDSGGFKEAPMGPPVANFKGIFFSMYPKVLEKKLRRNDKTGKQSQKNLEKLQTKIGKIEKKTGEEWIEEKKQAKVSEKSL